MKSNFVLSLTVALGQLARLNEQSGQPLVLISIPHLFRANRTVPHLHKYCSAIAVVKLGYNRVYAYRKASQSQMIAPKRICRSRCVALPSVFLRFCVFTRRYERAIRSLCSSVPTAFQLRSCSLVYLERLRPFGL